MNKSIIIIALVNVFFALQMNAQFNKSTRFGITGYSTSSVEGTIAPGSSVESYWVVPPIFLESERRFAKIFTFGTEMTYGKQRFDVSTPYSNQSLTSTLAAIEAQLKVSLTIVRMIEIYGQASIGYAHAFIKSDVSDASGFDLDSSFDFGSYTTSGSVGASIIFGGSFGAFVEVGALNATTTKTMAELYDDSAPAGASSSQIGLPNEPVSNTTGFAKIGLVFAIK